MGKKRKNAKTAQDVQVQGRIHCIFTCVRLNLQPHFQFQLFARTEQCLRILNLYRLSNYKNAFMQGPSQHCIIFAINELTEPIVLLYGVLNLTANALEQEISEDWGTKNKISAHQGFPCKLSVLHIL